MLKLIMLAAAVALMAACGGGPSQAASAAIVGATGVPLSTVQDRIVDALARTPGSGEGKRPSAIARELVTRSVIHALSAEAARRGAIVIEPGQLDGAVTAAERSGGERPETPDARRERVYAELVTAELARRDLDRLTVTLDVAELDDQAAAEQLAAQAVRADSVADRVFEQQGATGIEIRAADVAAADPVEASTPAFGTPAGRVAHFESSPTAGTWVVLRVTGRRTDIAGGPPVAVGLDRASLALIGIRLLQPLAEELGVRINPRYGVWDPLSMRVVPEGSAVGRVQMIGGSR